MERSNIPPLVLGSVVMHKLFSLQVCVRGFFGHATIPYLKIQIIAPSEAVFLLFPLTEKACWMPPEHHLNTT
jgi:hypothetical protein